MKKLYLKDIAHQLNVSKTTVSLVLNNKGDENKISKETQNRILEFARKHNYKPNQLARGLSLGKSETIGLIVPDISDIFYARIASCVEKKAKEFGYNVVFSSSNESPETEQELIRTMLNRQVDGLIIASTQQNAADIEQLKQSSFPFVLIDRHYPEIETNYVLVDNYKGVKLATEHLYNNGRRCIGFVSLHPQLEAIRQRLRGYKETLESLGLKPEKAFIKELDKETHKTAMKKAIFELVSKPVSVDAIVFSTHYLTSMGLRELRALGKNVPKDVAIVSFDEMSAFDLVDPPITSILQPFNDIGNLAVECLFKEMKNKMVKIDHQHILEVELLIRKSCGS
ncbi:MAG: LacI family transcriptional regulator [Bacteroidetes bacterium]|nr:MAG: LacI family transcriptional regulator [Bacteroidota bacterium]